jgi:hypothetical protein
MRKSLVITTPNGTHPFTLQSVTKKGKDGTERESFRTVCESPAAVGGSFPAVKSLGPVEGWNLSVEGSKFSDKFTVRTTRASAKGPGGNPVADATLHIKDGDSIVAVTFRFNQRSDGAFNLNIVAKRNNGGKRGRTARPAVSAAAL